jgi:ribosomal protein S18 acetylase RimI-like enzyme
MRIEFFTSEQLDLAVELFHDMSVHYNGPDASERSTIRRNLLENILGEHSGVRLVIATQNGRPVGLASIAILYPAPRETGQLFMKELYVVSGCRGQGVGEALMHFVARHAVAMGCVRFDWTVDRANGSAVEFYRKLGVHPTEEKLYFRVSGEDLERFASSVPHVG